MTTFDNKEKAEENKYAHDREVEFKVHARFHGLLAAWIAGKAGLDAEKAGSYKQALIHSGLSKNDPEALFYKVKQELQAYHVAISDHNIREEMHHMLQAARKQVLGS